MRKKTLRWTHCYVCGNKLFHPTDVKEGSIVKCGLCHDVIVYPLIGPIDRPIPDFKMEMWK